MKKILIRLRVFLSLTILLMGGSIHLSAHSNTEASLYSTILNPECPEHLSVHLVRDDEAVFFRSTVGMSDQYFRISVPFFENEEEEDEDDDELNSFRNHFGSNPYAMVLCLNQQLSGYFYSSNKILAFNRYNPNKLSYRYLVLQVIRI
jgi:hypothetical protein